jgi:anti-sigma-K factor RskA
MDINKYIKSGIVELYVTGLCSTDEEAEVEQLRKQYPELQAAITSYELEMEKNMMRHSTLPDAETDEKILQKLATMQQAPVMSIAHIEGHKKKTNWWKPVAAAASLLLAASLYYNYTQFRNNNRLKDMAAASTSSLPPGDYEIITNPTITPVALYGVGSHAICRCTMFWDKKTGKAYIMIHHLPQSGESKDYQLWAYINGKHQSVGIINDKIRGRFIEISGVPAGADSFTVTLEKTGGAIVPTENETYLAGRI